MNSARLRDGTSLLLFRLTFLVTGGVMMSGSHAELTAQDPCPSASGPDAEAGWVAYQEGDMAEARVGYRLGSGRELLVSYRYSTAGLTNSATGVTGYDYSALTAGVSWAI